MTQWKSTPESDYIVVEIIGKHGQLRNIYSTAPSRPNRPCNVLATREYDVLERTYRMDLIGPRRPYPKSGMLVRTRLHQ